MNYKLWEIALAVISTMIFQREDLIPIENPSLLWKNQCLEYHKTTPKIYSPKYHPKTESNCIKR